MPNQQMVSSGRDAYQGVSMEVWVFQWDSAINSSVTDMGVQIHQGQ